MKGKSGKVENEKEENNPPQPSTSQSFKFNKLSTKMKLPEQFYTNEDVVDVARKLLGKCIYTLFNNTITAGIITETEAYAGITDKASHAYGGRRTKRTEVMYQKGGTAYVYFCYGMHSLFNVVTNKKDIPHAVLIRAIKPIVGIDIMLDRVKKTVANKSLANGPGKVSKLLGIHCEHTGVSLLGNDIWIEDIGFEVNPSLIQTSKRIGINYAAEDALLPYRFYIT